MIIKQAILYGAGQLSIEDVSLEAEDLAPGHIFVETEVSALSTGTDLGNYLGDSTYVPGAPDYPRWVGYSNAGVIRAVGSTVRTFQPGDRVFSTRPHQSAFLASETELLVLVPKEVSSAEASLTY